METLENKIEPSKKERKALKRQQKEQERLRHQRNKKMKRIFIISGIVSVVGLALLSLVWFIITKPPVLESEIISRNGIHQHITLTVKVLGQYQTIPDDIGSSATRMKSIHTHNTDSAIHLEFPGLVTRDDIRLGQFFKSWGKQFNDQCIFDECNGTLTMLVNGKLNYEFENYIMKDNDAIEITLE